MTSNSRPPVAARPSTRERPRPPPPAVAEAEKQWIFTEDDLLRTPSIIDGMSVEEERTLRKKGVNFILQVGMMLRLPQTTLGTASVFLNRFMMRHSLVAKPGYKPLHHYQIGATSLFLATKVEENCRKMKEMAVACVRVALKDPNRLVDEQTKDYWKWRDTILYSEDVLLELLCFDVSVESPHKLMYDMLKYYGVEHNKRLRNAAWAFLCDSSLTQLCLLFSSRTIAAASLYCGARMAEVAFPDEDGKPWWEIQYVKLRDIRKACNIMADIYENTPTKDGGDSIYVGLRTAEDTDHLDERTRLRSEQTPMSPAPDSVGMERSASEQSLKRKREDTEKPANGTGPKATAAVGQNGNADNPVSQESETSTKRPKLSSTTNGVTGSAEKDSLPSAPPQANAQQPAGIKPEGGQNGSIKVQDEVSGSKPDGGQNGTIEVEDEVSEEGEVEE